MLKEDTVTLPTHLLAPMNEEAELLDQQFEKGWDAAVRAAFEIVELEVGGGPGSQAHDGAYPHAVQGRTRDEGGLDMDCDNMHGPWRAREDWVMAQHVDEAIDMLVTGRLHAEVQTYMTARMVALPVQRRVLAGQGVRRHIDRQFNF